jgi:hypothetical protein
MNIYHAWCDLKPGVTDIAFSESAAKYLDHLHTKGMIESWRITRRKLGLGQPELGDFHLMIEVKDLTQLDRAFDHVAELSGASRPRAFILALIPWCKMSASRFTAISPIRNVSEALSGSNGATADTQVMSAIGPWQTSVIALQMSAFGVKRTSRLSVKISDPKRTLDDPEGVCLVICCP